MMRFTGDTIQRVVLLGLTFPHSPHRTHEAHVAAENPFERIALALSIVPVR
jgi:hypothetical protein